MNINKELEGVRDRQDLLAVAKLAIAYAEFAKLPYVGWASYDGDPAQLAVYTVKIHRDRGSMGSLLDSLGIK